MASCDLFLFFSLAVPTAAVDKLTDAFGKLGTKATAAQNGLNKLKNRWNEAGFADRGTVVDSLESAASNIGAFANAGEDPVAAIQAGLNMVAQFAALAGPYGQIASVVLSFVSGILSLFGAGGEQKSVGEIVREQIDEALDLYYEKDLSNQAEGTIATFDVSKAYVDNLAQRGETLTVDQTHLLSVNVPLYLGLTFMGTLASEIKSLLAENKRDDAKKVLKYIELYTTMAVLKDIILQETAALIPDELAPNRESLLVVQIHLRDTQRKFLKFLYESDVGIIAIPYFDPDVYPITDAYLSTVLQVPNYDRSLAGIWCLTPNVYGKELLPLAWGTKHDSLTINGHPYITVHNDGCFWKLVPHGKHLFSIINTAHCPNNKYCGQYMSFGIISGQRNRAIVKHQVILWEIYGVHQKRCGFIFIFARSQHT